MMILEFILVFGFLLFVHEFGHFIFAKLFKIDVEEFGFGFPPRLVKIGKFRETEITLNWIPFGAFVRLKGENDANVEGGFGQSSVLARFMTLIGGPLFNLIVGIVLFTVIFMQLGVPNYNAVQVYDVNQNSPAETAGMQTGDLILQLNGQPINDTDQLVNLIGDNAGKEISIEVQKENGETVTINTVPREDPPPGEGYLGITLSYPMRSATWFEALPYSFRAIGDYTYQLFALPGRLIRGTVSAEEARPVGPVGIYNIYTQARERDEESTTTAQPENNMNTLLVLAIISVALGLTNLLPIPALDGGRLALLLPEILFRKKVPPKYENAINMIGFVLLLALMVIITTMDIINPVAMP